MLKVTVSGGVEAIFIGNDAQVFKYLSDLKKKQVNMVKSDGKKSYNLTNYKQTGLKIKIEKIENEFF